MNSTTVPRNVDRELPLAAPMLPLESSVDQINILLFLLIVLSSMVAQRLMLFMQSVPEAIGRNTVSWEVIFCLWFNWHL